MKALARLSSVFKDHNALIIATFTRRSAYRNPSLEAAVISATSHDESSVDYRNGHRVYKWLRTSQANIGPLARVLAKRMDRTRSWVVALKGLMLMHGILCCKVPALGDIQHLPFDFSSFSDGHARPSKMWAINAFIRVYFAYLDHCCAFLSEKIARQSAKRRPYYLADYHLEDSLDQELSDLQTLQFLLDMLLQIRPLSATMKRPLILEALDCVIIEIFDVYGKICNGIASMLLQLSRNMENRGAAATALMIIEKATSQSEDMLSFFDFCRDFGVSNANEVPKFVDIPEQDIRAIENMINVVPQETEEVEEESSKATVQAEEKEPLKTVITEEWEIFEDSHGLPIVVAPAKPEEDPQPPLIDIDQRVSDSFTMPDLITF